MAGQRTDRQPVGRNSTAYCADRLSELADYPACCALRATP